MTVETAMPAQELLLRKVLEKVNTQEQIIRSLRQRISILVYTDEVGCHRSTLPSILDQECQQVSALLTSPNYDARSSDPGRTHRIKLLSITGAAKHIGYRHDAKSRWGYEPFATFNFDYRDSELLKQLDLPVSAKKSFDLPEKEGKRKHDTFMEDHNSNQYHQSSSNDVKPKSSLDGAPSGKRSQEEGCTRRNDGYGPGSYYRPCASRSRRSVDREETSAPTFSDVNTIPVSSCRTSQVTNSICEREEPGCGVSHMHPTEIMSKAPRTSTGLNGIDPRKPHSLSTNALSRHRDPRRFKQPDSAIETPKSPPAQSSKTQPAAFQIMSQETYAARISAVKIPGKFIRKNATKRKIMPVALLRTKEAEDEQRERREWEVDHVCSGGFHKGANE